MYIFSILISEQMNHTATFDIMQGLYWFIIHKVYSYVYCIKYRLIDSLIDWSMDLDQKKWICAVLREINLQIILYILTVVTAYIQQ